MFLTWFTRKYGKCGEGYKHVKHVNTVFLPKASQFSRSLENFAEDKSSKLNFIQWFKGEG